MHTLSVFIDDGGSIESVLFFHETETELFEETEYDECYSLFWEVLRNLSEFVCTWGGLGYRWLDRRRR